MRQGRSIVEENPCKMEIVDGQSPQVPEEKTIDETTVYFTENGTVSKRRKRKSLGRRVSFAEAPKLHIFARDDEYVTPTRAINSAGSPHKVGERRSPRLAAKVVDADKENQVLSSNPAAKRGRRRGGVRPLGAREGQDLALKPHNWLDARDPSSQAGDDENTGPVDLRHLSFDQKETETDDENLTLDSTTFALRSLQQVNRGESPAVVQLDKNRSRAVSTDADGFHDEEHILQEVLLKDMSFTVNEPVRRRKPLGETITGSESMSSDTVMNMSITMLVSRRQKMAQMSVGCDNVDVNIQEDSLTVTPQKIPSPWKFVSRGTSEDISALVLNVNDTQTAPLKVSLDEDLRASIEERYGDLGDSTSPVQRYSPLKVVSYSTTQNNSGLLLNPDDSQNGRIKVLPGEDVPAFTKERYGDLGGDTSPVQRDLQGALKSRLGGLLGAADRPAQDEKIGDDGDSIHMQVREDLMTVEPRNVLHSRKFILDGSKDENSAGVLGSQDLQNGPALVPSAEDGRVQSEERFGEHPHPAVDTSPAKRNSQGTLESPLQGIKMRTAEDLRAPIEEKIGSSGDVLNLPLKGFNIPRVKDLRAQSEERFGVDLVDLDEDTNLTTESREYLDNNATVDMSFCSLTSVENEDRTITMGIPSLGQLLRKDEDEGDKNCSSTSHMDRSITMGIPSLSHLLREQEHHEEMGVEEPVDFDTKHRARETFNPTEEVEMMLTEEESTGIEKRATIEMEESPEPNFAKHRARETLNPTEEAEMMLKEEEFTGIDRGATIKMEESPGPKFTEHRARETLNPTEEAETMLKEEEFTGTGSRTTLQGKESSGRSFAEHRAMETRNPSNDAQIIVTEEQGIGMDGRATTNCEEYPGPIFDDCALKSTKFKRSAPDLDGKKPDRGINSSDTIEASGIMLTREGFEGKENRAASHIEEFTGPNFDNRSMKIARFAKGGHFVDCKESGNGIISSRQSGHGATGKWSTTEDSHCFPALESVTPEISRSSDLLAADMKSRHSTPVRPVSRSMWLTPPSALIAVRAKDESCPESEDDNYGTTAPTSERIREDGDEGISATTGSKEPEDASHLAIKSDDTVALITDTVPEDEEDRTSVTKMSVDEFLQHAEVQFRLGPRGPRDFGKDPALVETHHMHSLSEIFNFLCPKLQIIMSDACAELQEDNYIKAAAVAELEQPLAAIFTDFQKAPEKEKHRLRKHLQRVHGSYWSLAEKDRVHFQLLVENDIYGELLKMKDIMMFYVEHIREQRKIFEEKCYRPFLRLQSSLCPRDANLECISTSQSKLSTVKHLQTTANLERIEDLKQRLEDLKSSTESKLGKSRLREQAAAESLERLKQGIARSKKKLSDFRSQLVETMCSGKNNLKKEDVARCPYLGVQRMKSEVSLLHSLQDGFQVKSAGRENQDMVVELSYRSLVRRRYVVRKIGTAVKVLKSTWSLQQEKLEEIFPKVNALLVFSYALQTDNTSTDTFMNAAAWTKNFGRLRASEAGRFTLPLDKSGGPAPTNLRESMQFTRILVGNLMNLMEEIGKCQLVINASSGGGVLAEPGFRTESDGHLQLELKLIDCISSVKFFLYLDMTSLPMTGYPLGDLPAKVEVAYCAPPIRHRFKRETLESLLTLVKPGYHRLERTYAAVGSFLASLKSS